MTESCLETNFHKSAKLLCAELQDLGDRPVRVWLHSQPLSPGGTAPHFYTLELSRLHTR